MLSSRMRPSPLARATGDTDTAARGETGGLRSFLGRHERAAFVILLLVGLIERAVWVSRNDA